MSESADDGWDASAAAWIADMGEHGDFGRRHVLDPLMLERALRGRPQRALDVGCGEGRFCRRLQAAGIATLGIDPTQALLAHARALDPAGDYRYGRAEALPCEAAEFDLVVSYLSLIDIPDFAAAIAEMARVVRPGGRLLVANLASFVTARARPPTAPGAGEFSFAIDHYLEEGARWESWRGIRVMNWHRPLAAYMSAFLGQGLILRYFAEPAPSDGDRAQAERFRRVPWYLVMEWERPRPDGAPPYTAAT